MRLHGRIAETLEEFYGDNAEAHAAELAHHFAEAESVLGTEKLVHYSLIAGQRALSAYAYEESSTHFMRGLAATGVRLVDTDAAENSTEAALLFGFGRTQAATVERHLRKDAVTTMRRAFDYYAENEVELAVAVAEYPMYAVTHRTGRTELLSRALELVPSDSHAEGRLLSRYGLELGRVEGDYGGAQEAFNRAMMIAEREGDEILKARTVAYAANVDLFHLRFRECLKNSARAIESGRLTDDLYTQVSGHLDATRAAMYLGELNAKEHAASALILAEKLGDRVLLDLALRSNETAWRLEGAFQTARDFSDRALSVSPRTAPILFTRAVLEYEEGDFAQGEAYLERLLETLRLTPTSFGIESASVSILIPWSARITGVMSRFDEAEAAAEMLLSSRNASPLFVHLARVGLALLSVMRGDASAAQEQYSALEDIQGGAGAAISMAPDRVLALLSQTLGNLVQAASHFENGLALCRKVGYRPELAWTCCDYADTLLQRNEPGDRAKAMSLLDESLAISSELGMRPLMERVLSRRDILKA